MTREEAIARLKANREMFVFEETKQALDMAIEALSAEARWIPCSERLPKENEYVDNVCKYYLIQDEYGDMHVAHLSGRGWETIESVKALGCDVVAWMPLPKPYREEREDYELATEQMEHDAMYEPTYNSEDGSM